MPTITLHDVPETLHQRLQQRATIHHRPIDQEVILLLEQLLAKRRTLECSQTDVKTKRHKSIKHPLCKWYRTILGDAALKSGQI